MHKLTKRQLAKRRKRQKEGKPLNGTGPNGVWRRSASVRLDKDVNINFLESKLIKYFLTRYDSLVSNTDSDVIYFLYDEFLLFSLQDSLPLPPNPADKELIQTLDEELIFIPTVKAVYCCRDGRGQGRQEKLFEVINKAAEELKEGYYCFTGPFELNQRKATDSSRALVTWFSDGDYKPDDYSNRYKKQRSRLLSYGLSNATYEFAEITPEDGQLIYIPKSLEKDVEKVYKSRIVTA
jgi:hypothetical protein